MNRVWRCVLVLAVLGLGWSLWRRPRAFSILVALIAGRSLLPMVSGIGTEPRYLLEALPVCLILCGLGLQAVFILATTGHHRWLAERNPLSVRAAGPEFEAASSSTSTS
jgi:hypothetical protein